MSDSETTKRTWETPRLKILGDARDVTKTKYLGYLDESDHEEDLMDCSPGHWDADLQQCVYPPGN